MHETITVDGTKVTVAPHEGVANTFRVNLRPKTILARVDSTISLEPGHDKALDTSRLPERLASSDISTVDLLLATLSTMSFDEIVYLLGVQDMLNI